MINIINYENYFCSAQSINSKKQSSNEAYEANKSENIVISDEEAVLKKMYDINKKLSSEIDTKNASKLFMKYFHLNKIARYVMAINQDDLIISEYEIFAEYITLQFLLYIQDMSKHLKFISCTKDPKNNRKYLVNSIIEINNISVIWKMKYDKASQKIHVEDIVIADHSLITNLRKQLNIDPESPRYQNFYAMQIVNKEMLNELNAIAKQKAKTRAKQKLNKKQKRTQSK